LLDADELDILVYVDLATLDTTGDDGATTGDREDILDGHEERLVGLTLGIRDGVVAGLHEVDDGLDPLRVTLERLERRDVDDRSVLVEVLRRQQLADLHLDELEDLLVVDHVALVQGDED